MSRSQLGKSLILVATLGLSLGAMGCNSARSHQDRVRNGKNLRTDNLTVGKVQRTIKVGMTNAEVIESLGSPNIVSTDDHRNEVWVYDKLSTETLQSTSSASGGIGALILGGDVGSGLGFGGSHRSGAKATTQRTLTVIVKFDRDARVHDIAYHSSQF